jgi:hypothetical protein
MLLNLAIKEIVGKAFDLSVVSSESIVFWYNHFCCFVTISLFLVFARLRLFRGRPNSGPTWEMSENMYIYKGQQSRYHILMIWLYGCTWVIWELFS